MAQIHIEPRPRRRALPFLIALVLLAVIAVGVWYYMRRNAAMDGDTVAPPPATAPADTVGGI